jgi:hypothetical protein
MIHTCIHAILQQGGEKTDQTAKNSLTRKLASFDASRLDSNLYQLHVN